MTEAAQTVGKQTIYHSDYRVLTHLIRQQSEPGSNAVFKTISLFITHLKTFVNRLLHHSLRVLIHLQAKIRLHPLSRHILPTTVLRPSLHRSRRILRRQELDKQAKNKEPCCQHHL